MAIKLLTSIYDFPTNTIIRDLSYDIEARLVAMGIATYTLAGGSEASVGTFAQNRSEIEKSICSIEELLLQNRDTERHPFDFETWVLQGNYDYNDAASSVTPIALTAAAGWVPVPNDGLGPFTSKANALPGVADIYDVATGKFDFSNLSIGDTVFIRFDSVITTTQPNENVDLKLVLAQGNAAEYSIEFQQISYKTVAAHRLFGFNSIYIGNAETRDNPAEFQIKVDDNASLVLNGWFSIICPRHPKPVV